MRFFGKGKCELTAIVRIFGMGKCKLIANFSATMMTSLPSISLSLSVSLENWQGRNEKCDRFLARESINS